MTMNLKSKKLKLNTSGPPALSLFSGAGGLDLGLHLAGGRSLACIEFDGDCITTLGANRPFSRTALMQRDIREVAASEFLAASGSKKGEIALLIGGPPCQPFSKAVLDFYRRRSAKARIFAWENQANCRAKVLS
jgi:DNA (cytosine-5)-methyltransferase 1